MAGSTRMPSELTFGPREYDLIDEIGRWQVELDLISEHCSGLDPSFKRKPGTAGERIDGIEYTIEMDEDSNPYQKYVRLRMLIPDDYPQSLPRVYPIDYTIIFDHQNHTYRDKKDAVHMCMLFPEDWTEDCSLAGLMVLSSIWMHKYMIWKRTKKWPGKGRSHCKKCSKPQQSCEC